MSTRLVRTCRALAVAGVVALSAVVMQAGPASAADENGYTSKTDPDYDHKRIKSGYRASVFTADDDHTTVTVAAFYPRGDADYDDCAGFYWSSSAGLWKIGARGFTRLRRGNEYYDLTLLAGLKDGTKVVVGCKRFYKNKIYLDLWWNPVRG